MPKPVNPEDVRIVALQVRHKQKRRLTKSRGRTPGDLIRSGHLITVKNIFHLNLRGRGKWTPFDPRMRTRILHLHGTLELLLNTAIESRLYHPRELEMDRMTFAVRLDLGVALGVVRKEFRPAIAYINTLRNRYAHKIDHKCSHNDVTQLERLLRQAGVSKEVMRDMKTMTMHRTEPFDRVARISLLIDYAEAGITQVPATSPTPPMPSTSRHGEPGPNPPID